MKFYQPIDDETSAEDILRQSASVVPVEQWDWQLSGERAREAGQGGNGTEQGGGLAKQESGRAEHGWWQEKKDRLTGWQERRKQQRQHEPSIRARLEAWNYYAGLYRDKGPDGRTLQRLIKRNGIPDWGNPYTEGTPEHYYDAHPEGLLLGEVEFLLQGIAEDLDLGGQGKGEGKTGRPERGEAAVRPASLAGAVQRGEQGDEERRQAWRNEGRRCWAILLVLAERQRKKYPGEAHPLAHLQEAVHPDNLWFVTWDAYQAFPENWGGISKGEVLAAAKGLGLDFPELEDKGGKEGTELVQGREA